jgi:CHAT domain-containing protein
MCNPRATGCAECQRIVARFEAELFATETQASLATAPAKAVEAATLSIARLKAAGGAFRLAEAWLTRGRAWIRSGLPVKAEADFLQGIEAFEAERTTVPSRQARMIAFPEARNLFSELIKLYVAQGLPDKAFAVAERGRARSLLDAIAPTATRLSRMEVGQRLRPNEVMAYYVVTDDQLFVWGLSRRSHRFARIPTDIATLRTLVAALRDQIDRGEETSAVTTAGQLYDLLLSPVEDLLKPDDRLVVVADDAIHDVPFSVLWSRQRRRFLVEDHAVVSTPSATIFFGGNGSQAAAPAPKSALIISVPEDLSKAANLPALRHADAEARDIAKLYGPQLVLEGASATKARFIDAVGKYDVIHFVGHAIANPTYPGLSRFVVAPDPAGTGTALYAYELEAIRRGMTSIVVLAACETAAGRTVRGEGVSSLARPFVAAGISTVVATMWNLPDRPAGRLFPAFHLALRRAAAADALRSVQLAMLRSDDSAMRSLSAWAGVVIIAGTPPG